MFSSLNTLVCDMSRCYAEPGRKETYRDFSAIDVHEYMLQQPLRYQLAFALNQVIAVSYFFWMYGPTYHEMMLTYSKWLSWFITEKLGKTRMDEADEKVFKIIKSINSFVYGNSWPTNVDVGLVRSFLFNDDTYKHVPYALSDETLTPYILYRNEMTDTPLKLNQPVFEKQVNIPSFYFSSMGGRINVYVYFKSFGVGYDTMRIKKVQNTGILQFLTGVINTPPSIETVLWLLAGLNIHLDITRIATRTAVLSYAVAYALEGIFDVDFVNIANRHGSFNRTMGGINPKLTSYCCDLANDLVSFICHLNKVGGATIDKTLFCKIFGKESVLRYSDKIVQFVRTTGTAEASEEGLKAYRESPLGSCEAIRLISLPASVAQGAGAEDTEQEPTDGSEDDFSLTELPDLDVAEPGMEADEDGLPDTDEDTSSDSDQSEESDDSSSSDSGEGETGSESETSDDPNENTDVSSGDDASSSAVNGTQPTGEPENLEGSDDEEDIVFKVSPEGSETVDSVLIREELDQFLVDILANPPKKLSPQTVAALTALQRYWVHILSVETIIGLMARLIVLPERIRNIQTSIKEKETNEQTV